MPRPPKKPDVDVSKLRDIEEYTHDDAFCDTRRPQLRFVTATGR